MKAIVALALTVLLFAPHAAKADPMAVRQTIEGQLSAFRAQDAEAAFAFAAPRIKMMFGTPERFIAMVRRGYGAVYDAREPTFLRSRVIGEGAYAQEVALVDRDGKSWTALYTLERQPDGSWRITGCYLREADGEAA